MFASLARVYYGTEDDVRAISDRSWLVDQKALTIEGTEVHRGKLG